ALSPHHTHPAPHQPHAAGTARRRPRPQESLRLPRPARHRSGRALLQPHGVREALRRRSQALPAGGDPRRPRGSGRRHAPPHAAHLIVVTPPLALPTLMTGKGEDLQTNVWVYRYTENEGVTFDNQLSEFITRLQRR